jgi:hypothetical protein
MTLEMNLGIICGCLSGVKPVLAVFFPRLFASSQKTRTHQTPYGYNPNSKRAAGTAGSARKQSFPFHQLPDVSNNSKNRDQKIEDIDACTDSSAIMNPEDKEQRNFAWASANGMAAQDKEIPMNAIQVETVVMRDVENVSLEPKRANSDVGSEDWIMEDEPDSSERTKR